MEHDDLEPYRDAAKAARVVASAVAAGMDRLRVCADLGVSEATPRKWSDGSVSRLQERIARKVRRLDRRLGRAKR